VSGLEADGEAEQVDGCGEREQAGQA